MVFEWLGRAELHIVLHFLVPLAVARIFGRKEWFKVWVILCVTNVVDVDHLLAETMYVPNRCSIGFHPLHSVWAIALYLVGLFWRPLRWAMIGLLIHMTLDAIDCGFMAWEAQLGF